MYRCHLRSGSICQASPPSCPSWTGRMDDNTHNHNRLHPLPLYCIWTSWHFQVASCAIRASFPPFYWMSIPPSASEALVDITFPRSCVGLRRLMSASVNIIFHCRSFFRSELENSVPGISLTIIIGYCMLYHRSAHHALTGPRQNFCRGSKICNRRQLTLACVSYPPWYVFTTKQGTDKERREK